MHTADRSASAPGGVAGEPGGEADFDHLTKAAEEMMATWAAEDDDHPPNTGNCYRCCIDSAVWVTYTDEL